MKNSLCYNRLSMPSRRIYGPLFCREITVISVLALCDATARCRLARQKNRQQHNRMEIGWRPVSHYLAPIPNSLKEPVTFWEPLSFHQTKGACELLASIFQPLALRVKLPATMP